MDWLALPALAFLRPRCLKRADRPCLIVAAFSLPAFSGGTIPCGAFRLYTSRDVLANLPSLNDSSQHIIKREKLPTIFFQNDFGVPRRFPNEIRHIKSSRIARLQSRQFLISWARKESVGSRAPIRITTSPGFTRFLRPAISSARVLGA